MSKIKLLAGLLILLPSMAVATVTHVTLWEALPGKSTEMMATAAIKLLSNPKQYAEQAVATRKRAIECFSTDRVVSQYESIYERVVG